MPRFGPGCRSNSAKSFERFGHDPALTNFNRIDARELPAYTVGEAAAQLRLYRTSGSGLSCSLTALGFCSFPPSIFGL